MKHPYHIVDPSPWPLTGSAGALFLLSGIVGYIHKVDNHLFKIGIGALILTIILWWRDVRREATLQGKHTTKVEIGLRLGILLFIIREIFLFFSFFWCFFHSSLSPGIEIGSIWPPIGVCAPSPFRVPLLNTSILLSSGVTITWTHMAIAHGQAIEARFGFAMTIVLGLLFISLQYIEYIIGSFTISDGIYGSTFFIATGFHGLHVIIGVIFIAVIIVRHMLTHFSPSHHFGFEARAWYWHFVDVVWLYLYFCIYWWGN